MEMKETIDVYEILRECAKEDMKLWSPVVGECTLKGLRGGVRQIIVKFTDRNKDTSEWKFSPDGKTYSAGDNDNAEVCLFPSKEMRDWSKFAWKKGDVLVYGRYVCIFEKWLNDDYTKFVARHLFAELDGYFDKPLEEHGPFNEFVTECWTKETYNRNVDFYISKIEEFNNSGKLNLSTLEIEQPNQEFKDGDIEDLPKKCEFKPFDRVLVRDEPDDYWQANLFACMNGKDPIYQFACVSEIWKQCIPYNEKTMHLLGTNDDYKEEGGSDE